MSASFPVLLNVFGELSINNLVEFTPVCLGQAGRFVNKFLQTGAALKRHIENGLAIVETDTNTPR